MTEEARGFGLRVGGRRPYIGYHFSTSRASVEAECMERYHSVTKVVIVTLREFNRLKRAAGEMK